MTPKGYLDREVFESVKLRITKRPPISTAEGVEVGNEYDTIPTPKDQPEGIWIHGKQLPVRLWSHEFEFIEEPDEPPTCRICDSLTFNVSGLCNVCDS